MSVVTVAVAPILTDFPMLSLVGEAWQSAGLRGNALPILNGVWIVCWLSGVGSPGLPVLVWSF